MNEEGNKILENIMSALGDNPSETLSRMLSSLSENQDDEKEGENGEENSFDFGGIDLDMLMKLQGLMGAFTSTENDERSNLLYALRPFLSEERRPQVDRAVKLLKLSSLAKTAQDMDFLKNLL